MLFIACFFFPGCAKPAPLEEIAKRSSVLTPGRYVGAEEVEDDGEPFAEKYPRLVAEVEVCFGEGERLAMVVRCILNGAANAK